jgi:hypothetical protein
MHNIYVLLTNEIIIRETQDCGPKHSYSLHCGQLCRPALLVPQFQARHEDEVHHV